jgi:hypothetical protein
MRVGRLAVVDECHKEEQHDEGNKRLIIVTILVMKSFIARSAERFTGIIGMSANPTNGITKLISRTHS